ncbi:hypothetical protein A9K55_006877 [Cordyceps militaris]|uniref:Tse2 ADP-ribosyltransferase toxin domain-containing protein n=1 Tax=Cordyceps militaris TaxID=73501 RepID=A0A2H4SDN9_CORMI|nr:hypothetical protein A9K55_006877 [Cordyceps militaris]
MPVRFLYSLPYTLFRLSAKKNIKLRDLTIRSRPSYDVISDQGIVHPLTTTETYAGPNGASMRPLGEAQISLVENFRGDSVVVYEIPENTPLPPDLVLVHEYDDHYSLQPSKDMTVDEHSTCHTKEQWLLIYREGWTWSEDYKDYFRWQDDGSCEWRQKNKGGESKDKPLKLEKSSKSKEKGSSHKDKALKEGKPSSSKGKEKASKEDKPSSSKDKGR